MITIEDIKRLVAEETQKLNKIGYYPVKVVSLQIVSAKSFYADANKILGRIRVSKYFLGAGIEQVRATIMHELIHMVPEAGHGHGYEWKLIAAKVNREYPQYDIKRVGSQLKGVADFSLRRAACVGQEPRPVRLHIIRCCSCGREYTRTRESRATLHPEFYHCSCGGSLKRIC